MKYLVGLLVLVIIIIIGWNLFPIIIGLVRTLVVIGFIVIFLVGIMLGRWFTKKLD
jgi:Sec-independent protein secretion pathway component TatC